MRCNSADIIIIINCYHHCYCYHHYHYIVCIVFATGHGNNICIILLHRTGTTYTHPCRYTCARAGVQAEVSEAELREISEGLTLTARKALKLRQCAQCRRLAMLGEKFSKCARCRAVHYCSRECTSRLMYPGPPYPHVYAYLSVIASRVDHARIAKCACKITRTRSLIHAACTYFAQASGWHGGRDTRRRVRLNQESANA
jgi:hypothetical protein